MASSGKGHRDDVEITAIGVLYRGPLEKKYWSSSRGKEKYPYPIGYQATRWHCGHCFFMEVSEGPRGPLFAVKCEEGIACSGQTPSAPWEDILRKRHAGVKKILMRSSSTSVDGPEMFGFTNPLVQRLCRDLVVSASGLAERSGGEVSSKGKGANLDGPAMESGKNGVLAESSGKSHMKARKVKKLTISNDDKNTKQGSERAINVKQQGEHGKRRHDIEEIGNQKLKRVAKGKEGKLKDSEDTATKLTRLTKSKLSVEADVNSLFGISEDEEVLRHNKRTKRPRSSRLKVTDEDVELDRAAQSIKDATVSGSENPTTVNLVSTRKKRLKGQDIAEQAVTSVHPISSKLTAAIDVDVVEDSVSPGPKMQEVATSVSTEGGDRGTGPLNGSTRSQTTDTLDSASVDEVLPKNASSKKKRLKLARPEPDKTLPLSLATPETTLPLCPTKPEQLLAPSLAMPEEMSPLPLATPEKTSPLPLAKPENTSPLPLAKPEKTSPLPLAKPEKTSPLPLAKPEMTPPLAFAKPQKSPPPVLVNSEKMPESLEYEKYGTNVDLTQSEGVLSIDLMCPSIDDIRSSQTKSGNTTGKDATSTAQQDGVFLLLEACNLAVDKDGPSPNTSSNFKGEADVRRKRNSSDIDSTFETSSSNEVSHNLSKLPQLHEDLKESLPVQTAENILSDGGHASEVQKLKGKDAIQERYDSSSSGSFVVHQDTAGLELPSTAALPESIQVVNDSDRAVCVNQKTQLPVEVKCTTVPWSNSNSHDNLKKLAERMPLSMVENREGGTCLNPSVPTGPMEGTVHSAPTAQQTELKCGINNPLPASSSKGQSFSHLGPVTTVVGQDVINPRLVCVCPKDEGIEKLHSDRTGDCSSHLMESTSMPEEPLDVSTNQLHTTVKDINMPSLVPETNTECKKADSSGVVPPLQLHLLNQDKRLDVEKITNELPVTPNSNAGVNEYEVGEAILDAEHIHSSPSVAEIDKQVHVPVMYPLGAKVVIGVDSAAEATSEKSPEVAMGAAFSSIPAVFSTPVEAIQKANHSILASAGPGIKKSSMTEVPTPPLPSVIAVVSEVDPEIKIIEETVPKARVVDVPFLPVILPSAVEVGSAVDAGTKVAAEAITEKTSAAEVPFIPVTVSEVDPGLKVASEATLDKSSCPEVPLLPVVLPSCIKVINEADPGVNVRVDDIPEKAVVADSPSGQVVLVKENQVDTEVSFEKTCQEKSPPLPCVSVKEKEPDAAMTFGKIMEHGVVTVLSPSYQVDLLTDTLPDDCEAMVTPCNDHKKTGEANFLPLPVVMSVKKNELDPAGVFGNIMENGVVTTLSPSYPTNLLTDTLPDEVSNSPSQLSQSVIDDRETFNNSLEAGVVSRGSQIMEKAVEDFTEEKVSALMAALKETEPDREVTFGKINDHCVATVLNTCHQVDPLIDTLPEEDSMMQTFWKGDSNENFNPTVKELQGVTLLSTDDSVRGVIGAKVSVVCPGNPSPVSQQLNSAANIRAEPDQVVETEDHSQGLQGSQFAVQPVKVARVSPPREVPVSEDIRRQPEECVKSLLSQHPKGPDTVPEKDSMMHALCHDASNQAVSHLIGKKSIHNEQDVTVVSISDPAKEIVGANLTVDWPNLCLPSVQNHEIGATNTAEAKGIPSKEVSGDLQTGLSVMGGTVSLAGVVHMSNNESRHLEEHQKSLRSEHEVEVDVLPTMGLEEYADIMKAGLENLSSLENGLDLEERDAIQDVAVTNSLEERGNSVETTGDLPNQLQATAASSQEHSQQDDDESMSGQLTKSMITSFLPQAVPLLSKGVLCTKTYSPSKHNDVELEEQNVLSEQNNATKLSSHYQNKVYESSDTSLKTSDVDIDENENMKVLSPISAKCLDGDGPRDVEVLSTNADNSYVSVDQSTTSAVVNLGLEVSIATYDQKISVDTQEPCLTDTNHQVFSALQVGVLPMLHSPQRADAYSPLVAPGQDFNQEAVYVEVPKRTVAEESHVSEEALLTTRVPASTVNQNTRNSIMGPTGGDIGPKKQNAPAPSSVSNILTGEHSDGQTSVEGLSPQPDPGKKSSRSNSSKECPLIMQEETAVLVKETVEMDHQMEDAVQVQDPSKTNDHLLVCQDSHACGAQVATVANSNSGGQTDLSGNAVDVNHQLSIASSAELNTSQEAESVQLNTSQGAGSWLRGHTMGRGEESFLLPATVSGLQEQVKEPGHMDSGGHNSKDILDYEGLPSTVKQLNTFKKMESALCLEHPLPVSAMVLNVRGDEVRLCVVCGITEVKERTFFIYQVFYNGNDEIKSQLLCTMTCTCEKSVYGTLNVQIPMEETAVRFSPDGQQLLLLDCFKLPQSCYSNINNDDGRGVNIVSFEKEAFQVSKHLQSDDLMQCLTVPGPQLLIAAGDNGCINCWEMDSSWRTCKDTFSLPRAMCDGSPFISVTRLSVMPGSPHMVLGCDYGGSFALWDTRSRTLLSSCHLSNHNVLKASWLDITTISLEDSGVLGDNQPEVHPKEIAVTDSLSGPLQCLLTMVSSQGGSSSTDTEEDATECHKDVSVKDLEWSCKTVILKSGGICCGPGLPDRALAVTSLGLYGVMGTTGGLVQLWDVVSGQKICELNELEGSSIVTLATNPSSAVLASANAEGQVVLYIEKDGFAVSIRR